jgi:sugar O-acyltransferase (sialic acid O-acetyltransferase NeuD family)
VLCLLKDVLSVSGKKLQGNAVFMVDDLYYTQNNIMGIEVIRRSAFNIDEYNVVVAIGNPQDRKNAVQNLPSDTEYATLIHPNALLSDWVEIAEGSIVTANSILTCNIKIGKHCHINLNTTIGHDCAIGDYFTAAPAVNISGHCTIGDGVYIGTNAAIREGVNICDDVVIGMSAVVLNDVIEKGIYAGQPIKKLR